MANKLKRYPVDQWAPDLSESGPTLSDIDSLRPIAVNSYPTSEESLAVTYTGFPSKSPIIIEGNHLTDKPLGSIGFLNSNSDHINVVGTKDNLYLLNENNEWEAVKPTAITQSDDSVGTTYSGIEKWEFVRFGDNVIGVAEDYKPVILKSGASKFVELGGNPPRAKHIAVISDAVFLGGIKDHPMRIQWSGFNNAEIWNTDGKNRSDFQDLVGGGGKVVKLVSGDLGLVFQESAIRRVESQDNATIFAIRNILPGHGTLAPDSVCWQGKWVYYYGLNGFYKLHIEDGNPVPIGAGKVDEFFYTNVSSINLSKVLGTVDFRRSLVWWLYSSASGSEKFDKAILYNFSLDLWTQKKEIDAVYIGTLNPKGYDLDDTNITDVYPSPEYLDKDGVPDLDDESLQGKRDFAMFTFEDGKYKPNLLSGCDDRGSIELKPLQPYDGRFMYITKVKPLHINAPRIKMWYKAKYSETDRYHKSDDKTLTPHGQMDINCDCYYITLGLEFPDGCKKISGLICDPIPSGYL